MVKTRFTGSNPSSYASAVVPIFSQLYIPHKGQSAEHAEHKGAFKIDLNFKVIFCHCDDDNKTVYGTVQQATIL